MSLQALQDPAAAATATGGGISAHFDPTNLRSPNYILYGTNSPWTNSNTRAELAPLHTSVFDGATHVPSGILLPLKDSIQTFSTIPRFRVDYSRFQTFKDPSFNPLVQPDGSGPNQNCGLKTTVSSIGGGVMGFAMGFVMSAWESSAPPVLVPGQKIIPTAPLREQMRATWISTLVKSKGWASGFFFFTVGFAGLECVIERYRAKHDVWNPGIAGFLWGALISVKQKQGWKMGLLFGLGCGGFSAGIEHYLES